MHNSGTYRVEDRPAVHASDCPTTATAAVLTRGSLLKQAQRNHRCVALQTSTYTLMASEANLLSNPQSGPAGNSVHELCFRETGRKKKQNEWPKGSDEKPPLSLGVRGPHSNTNRDNHHPAPLWKQGLHASQAAVGHAVPRRGAGWFPKRLWTTQVLLLFLVTWCLYGTASTGEADPSVVYL